MPNIRIACHGKADGFGMPAANTPSANASATAVPFGPAAPIRKLTSIGRAGPNPSRCNIRIGAPSHSTVSPRNSPCTTRT